MSKNIYLLISLPGSDYLHMCRPCEKYGLHIFTPVPHRKTTICKGKYNIVSVFTMLFNLHIVWQVHNSSKAMLNGGLPLSATVIDFSYINFRNTLFLNLYNYTVQFFPFMSCIFIPFSPLPSMLKFEILITVSKCFTCRSWHRGLSFSNKT